MTLAFHLVALDQARLAIATRMLATRGGVDPAVGAVELWPHQRDAVARLRAAIAEFGGALLADDVGTGKTFVALALATRYTTPLVVAPAALRESWRSAGERARRPLRFISFETLSRGVRPASGHDFVIVDEAHHARNPATNRYRALAELVAGVPALLLSATPIHNRRDDLSALLALFLGARAATLDDAALARCVVRRGREVLDAAVAVPRVRGPFPIATDSADDATPDAILSLPPPVPASDAGTAGALLAIMLLRQWASSQWALLAAIRRRLATAHALATTLDSGHHPTRAELAAWTLGDDAQQLVMSSLLAPAERPVPRADLRAATGKHIEHLRALRRIASADPDIDRRRARRLRDRLDGHPAARSIAFTQFAETVDAYWRELRDHPGSCALTARGGRIAGGALSRAEALGSFAPGHGPLDRVRRIDSLVVTDLASEGLDLQEASVLVHLDLPWTPARLEQRLGRIVRPGSPHDVVHVYAMEPPIRAAALLDIRHRLAAKLAAARAVLGDVMPDIGFEGDQWLGPESLAASAPARSSCRLTGTLSSVPAAADQVERYLRRWSTIAPRDRCDDDTRSVEDAGIRVSIASSPSDGWLALVGTEHPRLVGAVGDWVSDAPAQVAELCALVDAAEPEEGAGDRAGPPPAVVHAALDHLLQWLEARRGAALAGVDDIPVVRGRRRALSTIARLATAPSSVRVATSARAGHDLSVASRPLPASFERELRISGLDAPSLAALPPRPPRVVADDRIHSVIVLTQRP